MSAVVLVVEFVPREGRARELEAALVGAVPAVHAEDGCVLYALHRDAAGTMVLVEKWESRDDLERHAGGLR
ncbi:hypothetical protein GCM10025864_21890 [Luteimicrobium album]|uniref:ABM domain-containing protein n=1 Tax=Luteimicrobium album TaxID=1054550 RepID=A0ABQ6I101_9MICO|nr:antibiotic biosynthesis monooxygenase [Luteimicrobium album]GMA24430.1 hypothetical protein GCM10025864_21890 [Luteimicrobium album]